MKVRLTAQHRVPDQNSMVERTPLTQIGVPGTRRKLIRRDQEVRRIQEGSGGFRRVQESRRDQESRGDQEGSREIRRDQQFRCLK
jgi:hypothetical protein